MKKLFIIALIIGFASACTKSSVRYEQPGEISLHPVTAKATKAAVTDAVYPESEKFNVWAWWADVPANTPLASFPSYPDLYIYKGTFQNRTGSSWGGTTPYYWPTNGSMVFAGYSPASAQARSIEYIWDEKTLKIGTYIQPHDISQTKDLMWFDVTSQTYNNNDNAVRKGELDVPVNGVPVVFKHILTWLTFKFKLKEGVTSAYTVTDVKLKNIETEANYTSKPLGGLSEWTGHYLTSDIDIWSDKTNGYRVTAEPYALESTPNGIVVIPQSCATEDAQLEITYRFETTRADLTKTVYLNAGSDGYIWKPGKHYTYTITFGNNEIFVIPEVTDWQTQTVDIEVQ